MTQLCIQTVCNVTKFNLGTCFYSRDVLYAGKKVHNYILRYGISLTTVNELSCKVRSVGYEFCYKHVYIVDNRHL